MKLTLILFMSAISAVGQASSKAVVPAKPNDAYYLMPSTSGSVEVPSDTGRIVKLSDEEYARLQKLRHAVVDAETSIAKAHGVYFQPIDPHPAWVGCFDTCPTPRPTDHYQFAGQFLLINVPLKGVK